MDTRLRQKKQKMHCLLSFSTLLSVSVGDTNTFVVETFNATHLWIFQAVEEKNKEALVRKICFLDKWIIYIEKRMDG